VTRRSGAWSGGQRQKCPECGHVRRYHHFGAARIPGSRHIRDGCTFCPCSLTDADVFRALAVTNGA